MTFATAAASNLDAAIALSYKTEKNYAQRLTNCYDFAAPKPDLDAKAEKR